VCETKIVTELVSYHARVRSDRVGIQEDEVASVEEVVHAGLGAARWGGAVRGATRDRARSREASGLNILLDRSTNEDVDCNFRTR
jgi:hypothetical protein